MKRHIIPALGAAVLATGCIVLPEPALETGSIVRTAPAKDMALHREVASLRKQVRRISHDLDTISAPKNVAPAPVDQLRGDLERLNAVIAALQTDVAETRKHVDQTSAASSKGDASFRDHQAAQIADLRNRIDRTNAMLLELAQSLTGRTQVTGPVRASVSKPSLADVR